MRPAIHQKISSSVHRFSWAGGVLLVVCIAAIGCSGGRQPAPETKLPEVLVSLPVQQEVTEHEDFIGRTDAVGSVEVRSRVTGYLDKVFFKEGAEVKKGDVLFEIDPRPYRAELARTAANLTQAEARRQRLDADMQRGRILLGKQAIGQEEYDKIAGDRAEAEAAVGSSRAIRDVAKLNLDFTKVTAPLDGRISRQIIDPGNLVRADDTLLTTIVTLDPMYAYFDVDERTVLRVRRLIQEGKVKSSREVEVPLLLGLADEEDFSLHGTINFVDNKVDPSTGTLRVRGIFPNDKRILSPGMFVRVRLLIGTAYKAILVSERALGTDQGQKFLYVVNDQNEVVYRRVKVGPLQEGLRVILEGLKANERVIVSGLQRVRPGATVAPKLVKMPAGAGATAPAVTTNAPAAH